MGNLGRQVVVTQIRVAAKSPLLHAWEHCYGIHNDNKKTGPRFRISHERWMATDRPVLGDSRRQEVKKTVVNLKYITHII